ncbi:MAG: hypothetical protein JXX29_10650 [Deltaproteobacteria bacterium]|nr:hypothetical protein [Deltaproteobacteria bacterium]MBN2672127.1 hypothetical protein [Deltaproteobacteria bacterium]
MIQRFVATLRFGFGVILIVGCGHSTPSRTVSSSAATATVSSQEDTSDLSAASDGQPDTADHALDELVARDAAQAKQILETALASENDSIAPWAAVFIKYLQIDAHAETVQRQLTRGAATNDLLLKTLCWRWLAAAPTTALPPAKTAGDDPVTQLFAAVAYLKQQKHPPVLKNALALGPSTVDEPDKIPLNTLIGRAAPYDNGPLAIAIAFVSARRMELAETVEGITVPRAAAHRQQLLRLLNAKSVQSRPNTASDAPFSFSGTTLHQYIEGSVEGQPMEMLRKACVHSTDSLQLSAVRALAIQATTPLAGDLAAAAAAMNSPDERIRMEAARTYLLLASRSTKDERMK